ncbi:MAG: ComF family protein [Anaerovibrio sp.]
MLDWVLDLLFPPKCPVCGRYTERRDTWCDGCFAGLVRPHRLPLDAEMHNLFDGGVWALGVYEAGLRDMLRQLKYEGKKSLLPGLHRYISEGLRQLPLAAGDGRLAVPVPLHPDRLKERGFNQSELLFREPLAALDIPLQGALVRCRATTPQFGLTAAERRGNLQGAFALAEGAVAATAAGGALAGKKVILADDIMTTGATLQECALVLKEAGAASLMGLVAASGRK